MSFKEVPSPQHSETSVGWPRWMRKFRWRIRIRKSNPAGTGAPIDGNFESFKLTPLTPAYIEPEHGIYVSAINDALGNPKIRNIALSGTYGVGKSSVLAEVAERHRDRVVELSLSTLAPIEKNELDESVPKQAATTSNRIQQEIVKQLLYREEPGKMPGSRFRRIERFGVRRELVLAVLAGGVVAVAFLLTGWTGKVTAAINVLAVIGAWIHLVVLIIGATAVFALRYLFHGRLSIKQVSAGSATVTLDDKSVSYFDQYLDEIVYFFDVSKRNIIIFEDIDRFNDAHIFETLRALNTLLQAAPQVKGPIRFIYAIKDSIFDQLNLTDQGRITEPVIRGVSDPAEVEAFRANRTKFFDLVIPVVPFITHRSARNLAATLLLDIKPEIEPELIDLASRYVPDMRLLKNVRNEFLVFRDRIFSGDGARLKLSQSELFAMMLYKSTHLSDFEAIRIGKSNLDAIYDASRKLVAANIRSIEAELIAAQRKIESFDSIAERSADLGERLILYAMRTARSASFPYAQAQYFYNGAVRSEDDLRGAEFWKAFLRDSQGATIELRRTYRNGIDLSFPRTDLADAFGPFEPSHWDAIDRKKLASAQSRRRNDLKFLRSADISELLTRDDFLVEQNGSSQSLDAIARSLVTSGLAHQMMRAGYINRNFTLYTSTFHGNRVSPAATNFIIHHVERDVMDEYFSLSADDVEAVLREVGPAAFAEPALYNIAILDHLLASQRHADIAEVMVDSLIRFGIDQKKFLRAYLISGTANISLIERLVPRFLRSFVYLISDEDLEDSFRVQLVNAALAHLDPSNDYLVDEAVSEFLARHYVDFPALTTTALAEERASSIADLFAKCAIKIPDLRVLSDVVRQAFVANDAYEISEVNLRSALSNDATLALDDVIDSNEDVYHYVLQHMGDYLSAIDGNSPSVGTPSFFVNALDAVKSLDTPLMERLIELAVPTCSVDDIGDAPQESWRLLAKHLRFSSTFGNITRYIEVIGRVDNELASLLAASGSVVGHAGVNEDKKIELAKNLLSASDVMQPTLRASLVAGLELEHYLEPGDVAVERGELFSLLVKSQIIHDDALTYKHLAATDWPTRERYIESSAKFLDYVNPSLVSADLSALFRSEKVPASVKVAIINDAEDYADASNDDALLEMARVAISSGYRLPVRIVEKLAAIGLPPLEVLILLEPHLDTLDQQSLFDLIGALGNDYSALTTIGKDRPKVPRTDAVVALLRALKRHGVVTSYKEEGDVIRVNKNRK